MHQPLTKSQATIAKILTASEGLFLERNYAEVTIDQIAQACQLTKGALYHHFASKEELYLHLIHEDLTAKRNLFSQAISLPGTCRERLERLTRTFLDLPPNKRQLITLIRRDINVFKTASRTRLISLYQLSLPSIVETVIRDGIRDGELKPADVRLLSWHFVAMVEVILNAYADKMLVDVQTKLDHSLELFFHGAARRSTKR